MNVIYIYKHKAIFYQSQIPEVYVSTDTKKCLHMLRDGATVNWDWNYLSGRGRVRKKQLNIHKQRPRLDCQPIGSLAMCVLCV